MNRIYYLACLLFFATGAIYPQAEPCACCTEDHKAFDFWIGEWEVVKSDGTKLGTNSIHKDQDGCLLRENWNSANSTFTGSSTNFYNSLSEQWEQLWVDNTGAHLHLKGNRKDNQMVLISEEIARQDKEPYKNRITWTLNSDGTVRQLWEIVVGQEVETVAFDGLYIKKK